MEQMYYVQVIAENYLKNLAAKSTNVHEKFLKGLSREEFEEAFSSLLATVRQIYKDIADRPADFGMSLKEVKDINAKNSDYTNSNSAFLRVPNLLLVLGASSTLEPDGSLTVDCGVLLSMAKLLKITGLPVLLAKLRDYGFDISDFGKTPKAGETMTIAYIDNRCLSAALKSMTDALFELNKGDIRNAKNNDYFYVMNPGLLENETVKVPKLTVDSFYHVLDPVQCGYAGALHKIVEDVSKHSIHLEQVMRNSWSCTYTGKANKKVLMKLKVEQNNFAVKLNLQNINHYTSLLSDMPDKIRNEICNGGWECGNCNPRCSGGFSFEIGGTAHNKCHCGSFVFHDLTGEDLPCLERLMEKELSFIISCK